MARRPSVSIDRTSTPVRSSAPRSSRRRGQRAADGAHPPDRHVPVAGPPPDHVVQEAPVGGQLVGVGERPDQPVREDGAAQRVTGQPSLQRLTDRPLEELPPRRRVVETAPERIDPEQRLRQRREHLRRDGGRELTERFPGAGVDAELGTTGHRVAMIEQDPALLGRRERRVPAALQPHVETELVDDRLGQQADEVRVRRQAGVVAVEQRLGPCRTAEHLVTLEHQDRSARIGEVRRAGQTVVTAADDDGVALLHRPGTVPGSPSAAPRC